MRDRLQFLGLLLSVILGLAGVVELVTSIASSDEAGTVWELIWPVPAVAVTLAVALALGIWLARRSAEAKRVAAQDSASGVAISQTDSFSIRLERDPQSSILSKLPRMMLLPETATIVETPPSVSAFPGWARERGASDARITLLRVTVQGKSADAAMIVGLRAVIESSRPKPTGGIPIRCPSAGAIDVRGFKIELEGDAVARPTSGSRGLPLSVSSSDPEVIDIEVRAEQMDVVWKLEIEVESLGQRETLLVPEEPIRTIGINPPVIYEWPYQDHWVRAQREPLEIQELPTGTELEPLEPL